MEQKTHVRKLRNPNYIGSYELMLGENNVIDLDVKITNVTKDTVHNGDKLEDCTVVHLLGHKPFILNPTNEKKLIKIFATPYIQDWIGKSFTLYVARIRAFGENVDALRIRDILPKINEIKPQATPKKLIFDNTSTKFFEAVEKIKTGAGSIEVLKQNYIISIETENEINALIQKSKDEDLL